MESLTCINFQNSANLNETLETQTVFDCQDWNVEKNSFLSLSPAELYTQSLIVMV